jgi:hypothetical protein
MSKLPWPGGQRGLKYRQASPKPSPDSPSHAALAYLKYQNKISRALKYQLTHHLQPQLAGVHVQRRRIFGRDKGDTNFVAPGQGLPIGRKQLVQQSLAAMGRHQQHRAVKNHW